MHRLIWGFAGRTYHIDGNLISRLIYFALTPPRPQEPWGGVKRYQRVVDGIYGFIILDMPLQAVPVLEVDGRKFCQSAAIARYLAREFGMFNSFNP